ncbi:A/G-specific adenine glycosylase [Flavobacterium succinicans]|uniref:Adenine DNA glycosylase n=1 Tax=Flavobacterium succinicans TaxID=29536 RepID=A0A199XP89_9FLAO|nr:A/G-specific adenine glycosylase [Flavobacterium succinicans]OAZ03558.1 putative A/G-specific adenine glycosylase YfhQ [Flavobacterium succinicans]
MTFSNSLIQWYLQSKRDLPWRNTTNPYPIWLSEIILQQTRVAQGMPYFSNFLEFFPTIYDLAQSDEQKVLKLWQGLGYYSRARNLHQTAQYIVSELGGVFPNSYSGLLKLKGVGEYTAAAIASFAYNEPVPVVDGNVFRVLSRYFGIESDISLGKTKKEFTALAAELLPKDQPALFNQAIMEFGALQCVPKSPNCENCIFNSSCVALQKGWVGELPVKSKKLKVRHRYFNYIVVTDKYGNTKIQQRTDKGIWHNLYEFPLIETKQEEGFETIAPLIQNNFSFGASVDRIEEWNRIGIVHKLSHQHLNVKFWKVTLGDVLVDGVSFEQLKTFPFPIVIYNFIEHITD